MIETTLKQNVCKNQYNVCNISMKKFKSFVHREKIENTALDEILIYDYICNVFSDILNSMTNRRRLRVKSSLQGGGIPIQSSSGISQVLINIINRYNMYSVYLTFI